MGGITLKMFILLLFSSYSLFYLKVEDYFQIIFLKLQNNLLRKFASFTLAIELGGALVLRLHCN